MTLPVYQTRPSSAFQPTASSAAAPASRSYFPEEETEQQLASSPAAPLSSRAVVPIQTSPTLLTQLEGALTEIATGLSQGASFQELSQAWNSLQGPFQQLSRAGTNDSHFRELATIYNELGMRIRALESQLPQGMPQQGDWSERAMNLVGQALILGKEGYEEYQQGFLASPFIRGSIRMPARPAPFLPHLQALSTIHRMLLQNAPLDQIARKASECQNLFQSLSSQTATDEDARHLVLSYNALVDEISARNSNYSRWAMNIAASGVSMYVNYQFGFFQGFFLALISGAGMQMARNHFSARPISWQAAAIQGIRRGLEATTRVSACLGVLRTYHLVTGLATGISSAGSYLRSWVF